MKILFLDTSNKKINAAIFNDGEIFTKEVDVNNDIAEKLHITLSEVINESKVSKKDFDKFIVAVGPGSFTGIRMAVTVIKTYAYSLGKKVIPISTLELMASTNVKTNYILPAIEDRGPFYYLGLYDKDLNLIDTEQRVNFNNYVSNIGNMNDVTIITSNESEINFKRIFSKYKDIEGISAHSIKPNYLKNTNAEDAIKNDKRSN